MSAHREWVVKCDAHLVGLEPCIHRHTSDTQSLTSVRRDMKKKKGWARKHHHDFTVDLCYPCAQRAQTVLQPHHGRPSKTTV